MKKILFFLFAVLILVGCQSKPVAGETVSAAGGSYQNVTPTELRTMLKSKDFVLVNVHIPFAGNIPGTDVFIPYNEIEPNLSQLPADKTAKIVLYCSSGRMSEIAAEEFVSLGYTNVWNLKGGMVAWQQAGFELEK
jgi:rhodanese-related sulfurtransferase